MMNRERVQPKGIFVFTLVILTAVLILAVALHFIVFTFSPAISLLAGTSHLAFFTLRRALPLAAIHTSGSGRSPPLSA